MLEAHIAVLRRLSDYLKTRTRRSPAEEFFGEFQEAVEDACEVLIPIGRSRAFLEIASERARQIKEKGWTPEHDDMHADGQLAEAAACYIVHNPISYPPGSPPAPWPWEAHGWKPKNRRRDLVRAAALIVAEIERLDRLPTAT